MIPLEDLAASQTIHLIEKPRKSQRVIIVAVFVVVLVLVALITGRYAFSQKQTQGTTTTQKKFAFDCKHSVIGSGYGGVYYAWRVTLSSQAIFSASDFCIFEASSTRIGGRPYTYSPGSVWEDLSIDVGAYRFQTNQQLISNVVYNVLNANTTCWNGDCGYRVFRDTYGNNKGYVTGITGLLDKLYHAGMPNVFMGYELTNLVASGSPELPIQLVFKNGITVTTSQVLLNMPVNAIKKLTQTGNLLYQAPSDVLTAIWNSVDRPATKQYIWYDDAWWISKLGKTSGSTTRTYTDGIDPPALNVRFLDGPVKCLKPGTSEWSTTPVAYGTCKGSLSIVYSYAASANYAIKYFPSGSSDAAAQINTGDPMASLLTNTHQKLMSLFSTDLTRVGVNPNTIPLPTSTVVSHWNASFLYMYPSYHSLTTSSGSTNSDTNWSQRNKVILPLSNIGLNVFIANEAWTNSGGWAEGSLIMVERLVAHRWRMTKLANITQTYYSNSVIPYLPPPLDCLTNSDCVPVTAFSDQCLSYACVDKKCVTSVRTGSPCNPDDACTVNAQCNTNGDCVGQPMPCPSPQICGDGICQTPDPPSLPRCLFSEPLNDQGLNLYWEYVETDEIRFAVRLPGHGYASLGLGTSMTNSDIILGWANDDGTFHVDDFWSLAPSMPNHDTVYGGTRDITHTWSTYVDGFTTIYFQRKLSTGDTYDIPIIRNTVNNIIYAYTLTAPGSLNYHAQYRGQLSVDLTCL